jgi:hypothetical protein
MVGMPKTLKTRKDWINACEYAKSTGTGKAALAARLQSLKNDKFMLVLKDSSADKPAEEQTPEDYESVIDPACEKARLGFTDGEINNLIGELNK